MLTGEIKVNNKVVGAWSARNLHPLPDLYHCEVVTYDNNGCFDGFWFGRISHKSDEAAPVLLMKIMEAYNGRVS